MKDAGQGLDQLESFDANNSRTVIFVPALCPRNFPKKKKKEQRMTKKNGGGVDDYNRLRFLCVIKDF